MFGLRVSRPVYKKIEVFHWKGNLSTKNIVSLYILGSMPLY